jgi:hypothetical protein
MYELTSFLLTYDPAYAMMQECFTSTPSNFEVMPETQFVPELPTGTAAASVYTYQIAGTNLFARQFQACYYKAALVGSCAIIVNPTSGTYVIPSAMYNAYLTRISLAGAGVLDGGTLSFSATKTSTIGPYGSEILIHK